MAATVFGPCNSSRKRTVRNRIADHHAAAVPDAANWPTHQLTGGESDRFEDGLPRS